MEVEPAYRVLEVDRPVLARRGVVGILQLEPVADVIKCPAVLQDPAGPELGRVRIDAVETARRGGIGLRSARGRASRARRGGQAERRGDGHTSRQRVARPGKAV